MRFCFCVLRLRCIEELTAGQPPWGGEQIEESLPETGSQCFFQTALLYTSSTGDRRIRVHTLALPTTTDLAAVFHGADAQALACLLAKMGPFARLRGRPRDMGDLCAGADGNRYALLPSFFCAAVDRALATKLADARDFLISSVVESLRAFRTAFYAAQQHQGDLVCPEALKFLPLFVLALLKHDAFRTGAMALDDRAMAFVLVNVLPVWELKDLVYPRFYSLHDLPAEVAVRDDNNRLPMPVLRHLSAEHLDRAGLYLVKTAFDMCAMICRGAAVPGRVCSFVYLRGSVCVARRFLWVGPTASPQLIADLFGVNTYAEIPDGLVR